MDRYEDGTVIVGSWTVRAGVDAAEPFYKCKNFQA